MISETQSKLKTPFLDKAMIIAYLKKDVVALENKNPDDLKKIIQTYIKKGVKDQLIKVKPLSTILALVSKGRGW